MTSRQAGLEASKDLAGISAAPDLYCVQWQAEVQEEEKSIVWLVSNYITQDESEGERTLLLINVRSGAAIDFLGTLLMLDII